MVKTKKLHVFKVKCKNNKLLSIDFHTKNRIIYWFEIDNITHSIDLKLIGLLFLCKKKITEKNYCIYTSYTHIHARTPTDRNRYGTIKIYKNQDNVIFISFY